MCEEGSIMTIKAGELNMLDAPEKEAKIVGKLSFGQRVEILQVDGDYAEVMIEPFWVRKEWLK